MSDLAPTRPDWATDWKYRRKLGQFLKPKPCSDQSRDRVFIIGNWLPLIKMVIIIEHVVDRKINHLRKRGHTLDGSCEKPKPNVRAGWDHALVVVRIAAVLVLEHECQIRRPAPGSDLSGNPDFLRRKSIKCSGRNPSVHLSKKCWSVGKLGVSWETSLGCLTVSQLVQSDTGSTLLYYISLSSYA